MVFTSELLAHFGAGLAVLVTLLAVRRAGLRRFDAAAYALAGIVGALGLYNFGVLHHFRDLGFVNRWEQFHYQLGSKYFPELRYDGLYAASLAAQAQTAPGFPTGPVVRHLGLNELHTIEAHAGNTVAVQARFSPERWREFALDHHVFLENTPQRMWNAIRKDHGYNPTPFWTVVGRLFSAHLPSGYGSLVFLGLLDIALLLGSFALLFSTYGYRAGCLALAIAGLGYGWQYIYIGAFLRLDWLAAVVAGVCMLTRERFAVAGACFAYAALARVFPLAFLVGPALLTLADLRKGRSAAWALRFATGFAVFTLLGLAATGVAVTGLSSWLEFIERINEHMGAWSANRIGLGGVIIHGPAYLWQGLQEANPVVQGERLLSQRIWIYYALQIGLCALTMLAMRRVDRAQSAVLGVVLIFALSTPPAYYWIVLLLVPIVFDVGYGLALIALWCGLYGLALALPGQPNAEFRFAVMSWAFLLLAVAWLGLILRRTSTTPANSSE